MNEQFPSQVKFIATVRDVARMVGLSPARFYQLQHAGIFPMPVYDLITRRPQYTQEQQEQCLEVRRRNCGINGKPILFYARRIGAATPPKQRNRNTTSAQKSGAHTEIVEGLKSLGMTSATTSLIDMALRDVFPKGTSGVTDGEIIKQLFVHLRRQNRGDNLR
jgi:hypothetical protein